MSKYFLNLKIEQLRENMIQLALEKGLLDQEVINLSQQLDYYIVRLQKYENRSFLIRKWVHI
ncbi:aspartyl-phosphate phosphatase Spo0E family protein [Paenibacillus filicis]|uniref:Aspartyl-phosphate phosphatase Spo0E family protein n=1 Tax=Paenibacillus gyeongsangnamensis TaxID=3388067 RepID=A0ABT4QFA2_9BACL|nr:aspartyl-phosphate phosphatase Spo0E family protein [Paenibacillus filicis]MCZ8515365.1 aspartyl-phosphate phosphatase Spo0E family protein [Paenibacillus filicis]